MTRDIILFDLDGTLTDPKEGITGCVRYALERFGIAVDDREILTPFIGPPLLDSFERFCGMNRLHAEQAVERYRERFSTVGLYENRVIPGIPGMLAALENRGFVLAVASSKPEVFVEKVLDHFLLTRFFSVVTGSLLDGRRTDKAEVIVECVSRLAMQLGISAGEVRRRAVMVGDRSHDISGAKRAGVPSVGVRFGYVVSGELESAGADAVVEDPAGLERLLLTADWPAAEKESAAQNS